MNYSTIIAMVVEIIKYAYPVALIFGISGKLINFTLDLILNRKINL